jgi:hypothetical protein
LDDELICKMLDELDIEYHSIEEAIYKYKKIIKKSTLDLEKDMSQFS